MKLGSDTTNYTNYRLARPRSDEPAPLIGMGATVLRRADRLAATVVEVFVVAERQYVQVQEDAMEPLSDEAITSDRVERCVRDTNGTLHVFFKGQGGYWHHVGFDKRRQLWTPRSANSLHLGTRLDSRTEA